MCSSVVYCLLSSIALCVPLKIAYPALHRGFYMKRVINALCASVYVCVLYGGFPIVSSIIVAHIHRVLAQPTARRGL